MQVPHASTPMPPPAGDRPTAGLAIASLVLGILGLVLSLFLVGGALGVIGLLLALAHLRRSHAPKAMAWWGLGLSAAALLVALVLTPIYIKVFRQVKAAMADAQKNAIKTEDWVGVAAPNFTVTTLDGQSLSLGELKGKRVVLDFWATWCPPCVKEIPHFIELQQQTSRDELMIVGISSEEESDLRPFVHEKGVNYPVAAAKDLPPPYSGVASIPTTFFIDRQGIIQKILVGYHDLASLRTHALAADHQGPPRAPPAPKPDPAQPEVGQKSPDEPRSP